jgi:uncharacterized protein YndB with AHSA1/START domain
MPTDMSTEIPRDDEQHQQHEQHELPRTPPDVVHTAVTRQAALAGIVLGVGYGVAARFLAGRSWFTGSFGVMTVAFFFLVPFVLGAITVWFHERPTRRFRVFGPWIPTAAVVLAVTLSGWEGSICVIMALPVLLLLASMGGAFAGVLPTRTRRAGVPALMLLPFVAAPLESRIPEPERRAATETIVDIDAPPATVWPLVASVDSIRTEERRPALFLVMGFPKPVAATLSHEGVGGVRIATFEGGLRFTETVTDWEPGRRLRFTIRANGDSLPPTTLDPHVTLGGRYFDVLSGEYELVPLDGGRRTRLVLRSEHRLSTHFNPYAAWWTHRVMASIQSSIQDVHKLRAERAAAAVR